MLEEYPLLSLRPLDILGQDIYLDLLAPCDRSEAVEECPNCVYGAVLASEVSSSNELDIRSFAVLAFADEVRKERDIVMTSATPFALLGSEIPINIQSMVGRARYAHTHFWSRYSSPSLTSAVT